MPLIGVAAELVRRGHGCRLLANEHFRSEALRQGIEFAASTSQRVNHTGSDGRAVDAYLFPAFDGVREHLFEGVRPAADTVVVNIDRWAASDPVCEALSLRTVRLHLSPFKLRSLTAPSWPLGANTSGLLGETYRRHTLPSLYRAFDTDVKVVARINSVRESLGLDAVGSAVYPQPHIVAEAAFFPSWFAAPAEDWPPEIEFLGFPLPPSAVPLPPRLLDFLARFPSPLVFTPGTSVGDPDAFFYAAANACAELGAAGIFLSPFLGKPSLLGPRIIHFEHIELDAVLRHAALIVHHGGIGTTARALEGGVPQIISPSVFDQPDNGRRVEQLGVGRVIPRPQLNGSGLAGAVRALLNDSAGKERLARYRAALASTDALQRCADRLEEVRARAPRSRAWPVGDARLERDTSAEHAAAVAPSAPFEPPACSADARALGLEGRVVLVVLWPEMGHFVGPLAMARRLERDGARVVFAGAGFYSARVAAEGFEFVDLAAPPGRVAPCSVLSMLPDAAALPAAVGNLIDAFDFVLERYAPSLVLLDSLYSALSLLPQARGLPWAIYETDLPRELDPGAVPAPLPDLLRAAPTSVRERRRAWAQLLWQTYRRRRDGRERSQPFSYTLESGFSDALIAELRARLGAEVRFDRRSYYPPVARGPRLVLCSPELDFVRERATAFTYAGPCTDLERVEPAGFPWLALPEGAALVYCTLGTQSLREPRALEVLQSVIDACSARAGTFLVVACPQQYAAQLRFDPRRALLVGEAPQLALLRRAAACVHHGGFNTLKECALLGVPQLVVPLSHDQFRNAALVAERGLGVALAGAKRGESVLADALAQVLGSIDVRQRCDALRAVLDRANRRDDVTGFVRRLLEAPSVDATSSGARSNGATSNGSAANGIRGADGSAARQLLQSAYQASGADDEFSRQLAEMLERVRAFMRVPREAIEPTVQTELERLLLQLEAYRVEFRSRHAEAVRRHLPLQRLPELVAALRSGSTKVFDAELQAIRQQTRGELAALVQRMASVPLYGPSKKSAVTRASRG